MHRSIPMYQLDAFTDERFKGNPAAVCLLDEWLDDGTMLNIARENNLAETAFLVDKEGFTEIRWFTPDIEIDLCGHGTLASAAVLLHETRSASGQVIFHSRSGELRVRDLGDGMLQLDFPARPPVTTESAEELSKAFNFPVLEAKGARDLLLVFEHEDHIRNIQPDMEALKAYPYHCFVPTAPGLRHDFVSRVFIPTATISEDPVTGSAHCTLMPYWAERLGNTRLRAAQLSPRGGELLCELANDRVFIAGKTAAYLKGEINV